jgi:integrase
MNAVLNRHLRDYVALRRVMGHKIPRHEQMIGAFLAEHDLSGNMPITAAEAIAWANRPSGTSATWRASRLTAVRQFAIYVHGHDPALADLIGPGLIPTQVSRGVPYIYTPSQIIEMMDTALRLVPGLRGRTLRCVIGLMAATGMRISECLVMNTTDTDLVGGVLTVTGKRGNIRLVPLHPTTIEALRDYRRSSPGLVAATDTDAFFRSSRGTRPHASDIQQAFRQVTTDLGYLPRPGGALPRLHDLRHTFATTTLVNAHRDDLDVDRQVGLLSTYLGHVSPASTYWYLSAIPELLEVTATRIAAAQHTALLS